MQEERRKLLNSTSPDPSSPSYVITQIKDGAMIMGGTERTTQIAREYTRRKMPWRPTRSGAAGVTQSPLSSNTGSCNDSLINID
jgi:hypothetical protein